jgi:hypothetical protein
MHYLNELKKLTLLVLCLMIMHPAAHGEAMPQDKKPDRARYLTIPVHGVIGVDTVAGGFEESFRRVSGTPSNRCVVLTFDSSGGSTAEAERIIEVIEATGDRFERIGVVTRCIGPALGILLTCDRIYIAEPQPAGEILEFHAEWSADSAGGEARLREQQAMYRALVAKKPRWQPIISAMIDPTVDLYAWEASPTEMKTANTPPNVPGPVVHIELSEDLGVDAKQAIAAGLATQLSGGMAGLGKDLGYTTFEPTLTSGATMMAEAAAEAAERYTSTEARIENTFKLLSSAQDLVQDLPRQELFAERADPRKMEYKTTYVRRWVNNRWEYTRSSVTAWKRNTDNAIQQWQVLVDSLDQIARLGNQARADITVLERESADWDPDDSRHEALEVLETELGSLLAQDASLGIMRSQAVSQIDFLQRNRSYPVN